MGGPGEGDFGQLTLGTWGLTDGPGWGLGSWTGNNWSQSGPPRATSQCLSSVCACVCVCGGGHGGLGQERAQWGSLWAPLHSGDILWWPPASSSGGTGFSTQESPVSLSTFGRPQCAHAAGTPECARWDMCTSRFGGRERLGAISVGHRVERG